MALDPKWKQTIDDAITNPAWDDYDSTISQEIHGYNVRLATSPNYLPVDPSLFKALLWVESGGPASASWVKRVMQIGNPGDPAFDVVRHGREGSALIAPPDFKHDLRAHTIDNPRVNIRAGILYAMSRFASFANKSVDDPADNKEYPYHVIAGDSLDKIAHKMGTTVELLQALNPSARAMIHPKQPLKYRKASIKLVITAWTVINPSSLARLYNGGGDPSYAEKIQYALDTLKKLKRTK